MGQRATAGRAALLVALLLAAALVAAVLATVRTLSGGSAGPDEPDAGAPQGVLGPVLLVPGYGGATVDAALQDLCPGLQVDHAGLPIGPVVQELVLRALGADDAAPSATSCVA